MPDRRHSRVENLRYVCRLTHRSHWTDDDFVHEQADPFQGFQLFAARTALQQPFAAALADQRRIAELRIHNARLPIVFDKMSEFHEGRLAGQDGQRLSNPEKILHYSAARQSKTFNCTRVWPLN